MRSALFDISAATIDRLLRPVGQRTHPGGPLGTRLAVTVMICVNNSSSGNGVQCVPCATGQDCAIVPRVPETTRGGFVAGILTKNPQKR